MSLEDKFNEIAPPPPKCTTCLWYAKLNPADKEFFDQKSSTTVTGDRIKLWKAACENGLQISYSAFRDHLNAHVLAS